MIIIKKKESPLATTSIQEEENALLVMDVLGESVSARVKKYFFAQWTMRVTPNVFFSLEKQELEKVSFEK